MRRATRGLVLILILLCGGCAHSSADRVRDLNADGLHLFERGSYAQARDTFEAALALQPGDANLLFNLGQAHDRLGQTGQAESLYKQCLQVDPGHVECRHAFVVLLVNGRRRPEATAMVQDWLRRQPESSAPFVEDAWLMAYDGDLLNARGRLQQAVTNDPRDHRALGDLGKVYEQLNRPDRAVVLYERSLEINPRQPEIARRATALRAAGAGRPRPD